MPSKFLIIAALLIATPVAAHNGATGIVKERMIGMVAVAKAMKALTAMSKSEPLDSAAIAVEADVIASHSGQRMLDLFPVDSLQDASEARPNIWQNWEKFEALAFELETIAAELPTKTTPVTLQNALVLTGEVCSACHKSFRIKK